MEKSSTPVDDFIAGLGDDRRDDVVTLDALIRERMPDAGQVLWEGVFWGIRMPATLRVRIHCTNPNPRPDPPAASR